MRKSLLVSVLLVLAVTTIFTGCKLQMVSDIQYTESQGVSLQHTEQFSYVNSIEDGSITGLKFAIDNQRGMETHHDYGYILKINQSITDPDSLQETIRAYTCADITNKWSLERNTTINGETTIQGSYENVQPNMGGFADLDNYSDRYNIRVYAVQRDNTTLVAVLAINQVKTQLTKDEMNLMLGTMQEGGVNDTY